MKSDGALFSPERRKRRVTFFSHRLCEDNFSGRRIKRYLTRCARKKKGRKKGRSSAKKKLRNEAKKEKKKTPKMKNNNKTALIKLKKATASDW